MKVKFGFGSIVFSSITIILVVLVKRKILIWEISGFFFILLTGTFLHFIFELSSFWRPAALFGAVNESTWEHLKMVF